MKAVNFLIIITDTQRKDMVGAYGNPWMDTPHLDKLAAQGVRFTRAYTAAPVCTPARSAIFSGMYPQVNGAWANTIAPSASVPLMGTIFAHYGYRVGYTGKWHLDGSNYFGDGEPGGGFEPDWWYDGKRYAQHIGPQLFKAYRESNTPADLRCAGFTEDNIWAHGVADRAIDFLQRVGDEPFVLVASFDEPHEPYIAPPEYWEHVNPDNIPHYPNYGASVDDKPLLQRVQREQNGELEWADYAPTLTRFYGCNRHIDREIGRVLAALDERPADDTVVIYTSDHGDMLRSHGLVSKGPMMYEEIASVPFIVRVPGGARHAVSEALISQLDILPTMLELASIDVPGTMQGTSFAPLLTDPSAATRAALMVSFNRFAINHDRFGGFYPIRCVVDGRYKLAVNLLDTDELYDMQSDPYEMTNRIYDPALADVRARLHDALLDEMDRIRDPFRTPLWGIRPWRKARQVFYRGGENRPPSPGFPFEPDPLPGTF
ncbi:MAG: sulfatase-like hydrolase/transferase [Chloroflexota bacterium]